ncbi:MAG: hypothetical protein AVDCRST_MAG93-6536, partial [uncultured Chloroflexia bacterium]
ALLRLRQGSGQRHSVAGKGLLLVRVRAGLAGTSVAAEGQVRARRLGRGTGAL